MKHYQTFEDLLALGTEKIHEQTHISRDKVELVMTKSYGEIGRVQFMGYLSILEREYGVDLGDIRQEYLAFHQEHMQNMPEKKSVILQASTNSKPKWIMAGVVLIVVLMAGGYVTQNKMSSEPKEDVMQLTTSGMDAVEKVIETNATDVNESNVSVAVNPVETNTSGTVSTAVLPADGVVIHPIYKVWYGMIDMDTKAKTQDITAEPIRIDTTKNWLIILGHGRIELETPEGKKEINDKNTVWFVCEKGNMKKISKEEFETLNGGKGW
ncbi:MAG: hypothetical protein AB7U44_06735 [Sulfuricurvum sp.]|uniref:hypothetical protein n=1 Tax=Sulfuricurvum sp. TaxID=2025608 RepID=UPI002636EB12|nr:hypothetical protein [Sulfuricurvum sp.]MDD2838234.1 hypothetical protein [Sulfuricurvum sp.]MDD3595344.1 hypothetical protein [Sulfuricurvum sp.]MDD4884479.1 hypothetical protein [Sulfuricurvum sp.]